MQDVDQLCHVQHYSGSSVTLKVFFLALEAYLTTLFNGFSVLVTFFVMGRDVTGRDGTDRHRDRET